MRRLMAAVTAIAIVTSGAAYADTKQVSVMIDGQTYGALVDRAYIQDGYTMVSRDALSGVIRTGVQVSDGDTSMVVGGAVTVPLPVPAHAVGDDVYIPLRSLCDALGYQVRWIDAQRLAFVSTSAPLPQGAQGVYPISLPAMGVVGWDYTRTETGGLVEIKTTIPQDLMMVAIDGQRLRPDGQSEVDGEMTYRYIAPDDIDKANVLQLDLGDGNIYSISIRH